MYTRQWQVFTAIRRRTARLCSADTSEPYFGTYATEKNSPSQAISALTAARAILEFFPRLKHTKLVRTWAGMMDECADKVPVIDTCKEVEGLAIACGFTGRGFGIGPITSHQKKPTSSRVKTGRFLCEVIVLYTLLFSAKLQA